MSHPLIIAHRALTPGATENTRAAVRLATAAGADLIELDVRLSLDRQPVVLHDAFLPRDIRGRGWVRLWPAPILTRRSHVSGNPEHRVSRLSDLVREFPEGSQLALHLKDRAALAPTLRTITRWGNPDRTWLWLEHPHDVRSATRRLPNVRVTFLRPAGWKPEHRERYVTEAQWSGASAISVPWRRITPDLTLLAHQHHLRVFSRLEDFASIPSLIAAGLDGIITDHPAEARRWLFTPA